MTKLGSIPMFTCAAASAFMHSGCVSPAPKSPPVALDKYSMMNYNILDRNLGKQICIKGELHISSVGAHYALQPADENGAINTGFSRIVLDKKYLNLAGKASLRSRVRTACGLLEDATPFDKCEDNTCRWYKLTGARLS